MWHFVRHGALSCWEQGGAEGLPGDDEGGQSEGGRQPARASAAAPAASTRRSRKTWSPAAAPTLSSARRCCR